VDIGGGTTDLALVENGGVVGTKMFAVGGRVFTKRIEQTLGVGYEIAENKKIEYSLDTLDKLEKIKIAKVMTKDARTLVRGIALSLEDFEEIENFPSSILMCGGGSLLPEIKAEVLNYPWLQELPFEKFPKFEFIHPEMIADVIDDTKKIKDVTDVAVICLARMALEKK
jgi:cell division protein FtsA